MSGIGFGGGGDTAAHGIEIPDEPRVAAPSVGRGDFLEAVVAPEAVGIAERGDAAFGADAGTGEDKEAVGGGKSQLSHDVFAQEECRTGQTRKEEDLTQRARRQTRARRAARRFDKVAITRDLKTGSWAAVLQRSGGKLAAR